jgi:hypothetical protein
VDGTLAWIRWGRGRLATVPYRIAYVLPGLFQTDTSIRDGRVALEKSRVPHLSALVFERCGFRVDFMRDVHRFGNSGFGSPMDSTEVHKSDRWQQSRSSFRQGRNLRSTSLRPSKPPHSIFASLSPSLPVLSGRGRDSTRFLDFRNFLLWEGLFYFVTCSSPKMPASRRVL